MTLDFNNIGTEGLVLLSNGLINNATIETLSLISCNINSKGGEILNNILLFVNSKLKNLVLDNNHLRNEGVVALCVGL